MSDGPQKRLIPTPFTLRDVGDIPARNAIKSLKRSDNPEWAAFRVTGEDAPKEVFWKGRQWAVTDYGVETWRNAPYHYTLAYRQLTDEFLFEGLCEKEWVDPVDFLHAVAIALQRYAKSLAEAS